MGFAWLRVKMDTLAEKHPKRVRNAGDGARLLSSNDTTGFTFRGRFELAATRFWCGIYRYPESPQRTALVD